VDDTNERYQNAIESLKKLLKSLDAEQSDIGVHIWTDSDGGFRIAEISFTRQRGNGISGCSYMRSFPESAPMILACEDFVIWYGRDDCLWEEARDAVIERQGDVA